MNEPFCIPDTYTHRVVLVGGPASLPLLSGSRPTLAPIQGLVGCRKASGACAQSAASQKAGFALNFLRAADGVLPEMKCAVWDWLKPRASPQDLQVAVWDDHETASAVVLWARSQERPLYHRGPTDSSQRSWLSPAKPAFAARNRRNPRAGRRLFLPRRRGSRSQTAFTAREASSPSAGGFNWPSTFREAATTGRIGNRLPTETFPVPCLSTWTAGTSKPPSAAT